MNTYVPPEPTDPRTSQRGSGRRRVRRADQGALRAFLIILGVLALLGVVAGIVWQQLVPDVEMQMTEIGPYPLNEIEAGQLMSMDGWYAALAGGLGLIAGSVLATIFLRHSWAMVLGLLAGACVAAVLAFTVGTVMGNGEIIVAWQPEAKLWSPLSAPLQLHAYGVALIWPIAALAPVVPLAWWAWPIAEPDGPEQPDTPVHPVYPVDPAQQVHPGWPGASSARQGRNAE